ncbi:MAG: RNA polymerase sigma factor [Acidimicrobiales bacterium]
MSELGIQVTLPGWLAPRPLADRAPATSNVRVIERTATVDSEATLVSRLQAGDHGAWEACYRRAYPRLVAYAAKRLGPDDGRDAVGETMARAVGKIDCFQAVGVGFEAWLFGILRHVVADAQRSRIRQLHRTLPVDTDRDPQPGDRLLQDEEARALRDAFACLSAADQELLELRIVNGLSAEEVAFVVDKHPGAVRMAQSRALERLRVQLGARYA